MTWFRKDPAFFERMRLETEAAYPELRFEMRGSHLWLSGPFRLLDEAGRELTRYQIALRLPDDFPAVVPDLFETAGRIHPVAAHHAFKDGHACLWVSGERWIHWPRGSTLVDFLDGPVRSHLLGHAHFEITGKWPNGARSHGPEGVFESYCEMLDLTDREQILEFLRLLGRDQAPRGHWPCPCGSGKRLRACHGPRVWELRDKISPREASAALAHANADSGRRN
jgi:hypothetical protein